jgi:hypothetical protein
VSRLYVIQSRETGHFLVPSNGFVGWTQSLREAFKRGLVDLSSAIELRDEHTDDADVIFVRDVLEGE